MNKIKILVKENKTLQEGSIIGPSDLRFLMDSVLSGEVDPKLLVDIEKGSFSVSRPDMSGQTFVFDRKGNIEVRSNVGRDYIDFNADLDVGGFEDKKRNPAFSRWLEQGKEVSEAAAKELNAYHGKLSGKEYREAIGDIRTLGKRIVDKIVSTIVRGWKKIKVLFPRTWTSLKNRMYLKTMKYSAPKPKGVYHIGDEPPDDPKKGPEPHLDETDKRALKDKEKAKNVKNKSNKKVSDLTDRKNDLISKGHNRNSRKIRSLDKKIKKFKERAIAAETLEDAIEKAMKSVDTGDVAKGVVKKGAPKFLAKLAGPLGWLVTFVSSSALFSECEALGATKREATAIAGLDETLGGSFLVDPLKDWLAQRKEGAFLRYKLARGRVGARTEIGPYTKEDEAVVRRVTAHQLGKIGSNRVQKAYDDLGTGIEKQMQNPVFGDMQESIDKNFQRSNKIKIKINS